MGPAEQPPQTAETLQDKYQRALQEIDRLQGELDQARRDLERLQHQRQGTPSADAQHWVREGNTALTEQRYSDAVAAYTKALATQPHNAQLYRNRGAAYANLGSYQEAIEDFTQALAHDPRDAVVYNQRGIAHYQLGKAQQALDDFQQAIARQPKLTEAYNNRGIVTRALGNYQQAHKDFQSAAQLGMTLASRHLQVLQDEVRQAQERLRAAGFNPGPVDGSPGPQTTEALRQYQRQQGLTVTGRFDPATMRGLGIQAGPLSASQSSEAQSPPQFIQQSKPEYPDLARQQGWEGTVTLRLEMLADGTVGAVEVARSSGYPLLDTTAQEAARTWRHKPAVHNGQPVTRWVSLQVHFALDQAAQTAPHGKN
jgi:TonB family protein